MFIIIQLRNYLGDTQVPRRQMASAERQGGQRY